MADGAAGLPRRHCVAQQLRDPSDTWDALVCTAVGGTESA